MDLWWCHCKKSNSTPVQWPLQNPSMSDSSLYSCLNLLFWLLSCSLYCFFFNISFSVLLPLLCLSNFAPTAYGQHKTSPPHSNTWLQAPSAISIPAHHCNSDSTSHQAYQLFPFQIFCPWKATFSFTPWKRKERKTQIKMNQLLIPASLLISTDPTLTIKLKTNNNNNSNTQNNPLYSHQQPSSKIPRRQNKTNNQNAASSPSLEPELVKMKKTSKLQPALPTLPPTLLTMLEIIHSRMLLRLFKNPTGSSRRWGQVQRR